MPKGVSENRMESADPDQKKWRVGRSLGRTIYEQKGRRATKEDELLGIMETEELALHVVALHNKAVEP